MKESKQWGSINPTTRDRKWEDTMEWGSFKEEYSQLRPVGQVSSGVYHWIKIKKRDGSATQFPMTCGSYDSETEAYKDDDCPACRAGIDGNRFYFSNFIDRELQENKPVKAKKDKSKGKYRKLGSKYWSPIRVFKIPISCASQLKNIVGLNKHKIKGKTKLFELSDQDYGCDVFIKYDSTEPPASCYDVQKADHSPMTKKELNYKLFDVKGAIFVDMAKQELDLIRLGYLDPGDSKFADEKAKEKVVKNRNKTLGIEDDGLPDPPKKKKRNKEKSKNKEKILLKEKKNKKKKKSKLKCFGKYKAKVECFQCKERIPCIKSTT